MLLGHARGDIYSNCRTSRSAPHLTGSLPIKNLMTTPSNSPSTPARTPASAQQTMMSYARMSYRYTTVTLLSMRPQPEITIFPDHLVERRFLDEEHYIDLDRMLVEKAGKFRLESYGMLDGAGDGPMMTSRIHKYDFSDPMVIEKVKNRRPKDPLTPHQVAALTSVVTRHQPSTLPTPLLPSHASQSPHVWIDDYSHRQAQAQRNTHRHHQLPQPSMPYQRQNPNQCETYTNQIQSLLPNFRPTATQNRDSIPILQRLFQAQQYQQDEQRKVDIDSLPSTPYEIRSTPKGRHEHSGLSAFATPTSPQHVHADKNFAWPFSTVQNQKSVTHPLHISMSTQATIKKNQNVLAQLMGDHLRCSTTMQTPVTPSMDIGGLNSIHRDKIDDDEEQSFYSAPPSPTERDEGASGLFNNTHHPEQSRIYNQAALLNSLIRNMVSDQQQRVDSSQEKGVLDNASSNESCFSNDTQSTAWTEEQSGSYSEMYNLLRLLSPGVKSVAQQELLQYLGQGCTIERDEMLRLVASLNINEQNALKPVLARLINEQCDIMKKQHDQSTSAQHGHETRSTLESWFGSDIYTSAYPRMPSGRVLSACDLEQSRAAQQH